MIQNFNKNVSIWLKLLEDHSGINHLVQKVNFKISSNILKFRHALELLVHAGLVLDAVITWVFSMTIDLAESDGFDSRLSTIFRLNT